jgi:outer membrane protein assembly factor BamD
MKLGPTIRLAATAALSGCLFRGGGSKPPPPSETVETTRVRADSLYRAAESQFRRGRWSKAVETLDRGLRIMDYTDPRRARGSFILAEAQLAQGNHLEAVRQFRRVADESASDSLAPDALLRAGDAYAQLWHRPELDPTYGESALTTYREVVERYPTTPAAARAQTRIQQLQERFAEKEYRTGLFYLRYKAYDSAILTFRHIVASYPRARVVPEALSRLVQAYQTLAYVEDLRETCQYIRQFYPQTVSTVARRCPAAADTT